MVFILHKGSDDMFTINGIEWDICFVNPQSDKLRRSDGSISVAVTDWNDREVYISTAPKGAFLRKIIAHELVHCFMFSYSIHISIDWEEYIADWVATYGAELIALLDSIMYQIMYKVA